MESTFRMLSEEARRQLLEKCRQKSLTTEKEEIINYLILED